MTQEDFDIIDQHCMALAATADVLSSQGKWGMAADLAGVLQTMREMGKRLAAATNQLREKAGGEGGQPERTP